MAQDNKSTPSSDPFRWPVEDGAAPPRLPAEHAATPAGEPPSLPTVRKPGLKDRLAPILARAAKILRLIAAEAGAVCAATFAQTGRLFTYAEAQWTGRSLTKALDRSRLAVGKKVYQLGLGAPSLVQQIAELTKRIEAPDQKKGQSASVERERRQLTLGLADLALNQGAAPVGAETEYQEVTRIQTEIVSHGEHLKSLRASLPPHDNTDWLRVWTGYSTVAIIVLATTLFPFSGRRGTENTSATAVASTTSAPQQATPSDPRSSLPDTKQTKAAGPGGVTADNPREDSPQTSGEPVSAVDLVTAMTTAGFKRAQEGRSVSVDGEDLAQFIRCGSPDSEKPENTGHQQEVKRKVYALRNQEISLPQATDPDWLEDSVKNGLNVACRVNLRLYKKGGWRDRGGIRGANNLSLCRAQLGDVWFLTKQRTIQKCTGEEMVFVQQHGGVLYAGESESGTNVIMISIKDPQIARKVATAPEHYAMDIVFDSLQMDRPHTDDWGYYRLAALEEHGWDSDYFVAWNVAGGLRMDQPDYFRVVPPRDVHFASAKLLSATLRDSQMQPVASYQTTWDQPRASIRTSSTDGGNGLASTATGENPGKAPQEARAGGKKELTVDLGDGVKLEMVLIPAGEFLMGAPESDNDAESHEKPQHRVRITKPFYLGKYLVTQEQWEAVMGDNPSEFKGPKKPVEKVSWDDCQQFLGKLNAKSHSGGSKFQLPSEAQWEYACRAGSETKYCFGGEESGLGDYAWYDENSGNTTHPVGEKKRNAWGLYDMHGNVWEWCQDWYDSGYYAKSPTDDPTGPATGSYRVGRGGSWGLPAGLCRSAYRGGRPGVRYYDLGLRVSLVPADTKGGTENVKATEPLQAGSVASPAVEAQRTGGSESSTETKAAERLPSGSEVDPRYRPSIVSSRSTIGGIHANGTKC